MNEADINTNETNNMYKASTLSTKINTSILESPFDETNNMPLPARISEGVFCLVYLI